MHKLYPETLKVYEHYGIGYETNPNIINPINNVKVVGVKTKIN